MQSKELDTVTISQYTLFASSNIPTKFENSILNAQLMSLSSGRIYPGADTNNSLHGPQLSNNLMQCT